MKEQQINEILDVLERQYNEFCLLKNEIDEKDYSSQLEMEIAKEIKDIVIEYEKVMDKLKTNN